MTETMTGRCLCGAVSFRVTGTIDSFYLCHCSRCRRDSGSAHSANLFSTTVRLDWLSGTAGVRHFRLTGTRHARQFCSTCGSALPLSDPDTGLVVVPAGSLDGPVPLRPTAHISMASRADWDDDLAARPALDGLPG
ncbi:GFA family protein [uncultured Maritimibacter sp.]|jgi:hypothetical protein|uniref:GFA family protein n=1 Tax=uncultured Maritimibacter sp. TaxID=991866 RepID=UPI00261F4A07|nr:GFA family protein [uncultured Maritimibacter sp.]